ASIIRSQLPSSPAGGDRGKRCALPRIPAFAGMTVRVLPEESHVSRPTHRRGRRAQAALARLVRQSGEPGYDGDLSRALSEFRPDAGRVAIGQADHRHRADWLRPVAVQPAPPRTGE